MMGYKNYAFTKRYISSWKFKYKINIEFFGLAIIKLIITTEQSVQENIE